MPIPTNAFTHFQHFCLRRNLVGALPEVQTQESLTSGPLGPASMTTCRNMTCLTLQQFSVSGDGHNGDCGGFGYSDVDPAGFSGTTRTLSCTLPGSSTLATSARPPATTSYASYRTRVGHCTHCYTRHLCTLAPRRAGAPLHPEHRHPGAARRGHRGEAGGGSWRLQQGPLYRL